jgi:translation elongation factor EF-Tu-like GTPase
MGNPYLDREERTKNLSNSHKRAKKQEKDAATRFRGYGTPASGSRDVKGDVRVKGKARIECKTTKNKSFSVTLEMARKIEEAALSGGEIPVLLVEYTDGFGKVLGEVAVIPSYCLDDFFERT